MSKRRDLLAMLNREFNKPYHEYIEEMEARAEAERHAEIRGERLLDEMRSDGGFYYGGFEDE